VTPSGEAPTHPTDVVVVGGGIVGAACAFELADAGADVVLLDAAHEGRATAAGAGILSPETWLDPPPARLAFGLAAAAHYRVLVERLVDLGAGDGRYRRCGLLQVALRPGEDELMDVAHRAVDRLPEAVEEIDAERARAAFPPLGAVRRVLVNRMGARIDGRAIADALARGAERRGARRVTATAQRILTGAGRVTGVETDAATLACGAVVVAGGAWSAQLLAPLGVPVPVRPLKGQIVHLGLDDTATEAWPVVQPLLSHYLVAWPGGRVACGGTFEADAGFDHRPTAAGLAELLRECLLNAPGLAAARPIEVRVGLRPASPDGEPIVGEVPDWPGLWVCTGHGTEGLLLGPYSALLLARAALGAPADAALAHLGPTRFADAPLPRGSMP
jgi:D-amino-acid dehydrogenase